jgi:hypothetical protein
LTIYSSPVVVEVEVVWVVVEVPVVTLKRPVRPYPRDKKQSSLVAEVLVDTKKVLIKIAVETVRIHP